jgi:hypothetical protein
MGENGHLTIAIFEEEPTELDSQGHPKHLQESRQRAQLHLWL